MHFESQIMLKLYPFTFKQNDSVRQLLECMLYSKYICSALFGNLHNFEIALRILSIAKLRANFEIAYAISKLCNETTAQFRNGDV